MLRMSDLSYRQKMKKYYRTSDMLNLLFFFPDISPIKDIVLVESEDDYNQDKAYFDSFDQNRVDTIKGRKPILGIENAGMSDGFYKTLIKVKEKDPLGVLVLFNINSSPSQRYERFAGISVAVSLGESVIIEAVSKGFDGREVSKSICTHERYYIPWFALRGISIDNFKDYRTYLINDKDYQSTRKERIEFLKSIGLNEKEFSSFIPKTYQEIPDFVWKSVIKEILKKLEKNEDILSSYNITNFAISGHTEGKAFAPWGMFDKSRYVLSQKE